MCRKRPGGTERLQGVGDTSRYAGGCHGMQAAPRFVDPQRVLGAPDTAARTAPPAGRITTKVYASSLDRHVARCLNHDLVQGVNLGSRHACAVHRPRSSGSFGSMPVRLQGPAIRRPLSVPTHGRRPGECSPPVGRAAADDSPHARTPAESGISNSAGDDARVRWQDAVTKVPLLTWP